MNEEVNTLKKEESIKDGIVHVILSHSYIVFFLAVILGAIFHIFFTLNIFEGLTYQYIGFTMIVLGSALIYWAQSTSSCTKKEVEIGKKAERDFERGPYKYSRNPTHNGLTLMTLGLALVINSFFTFIFMIAAAIITKMIFLKKEEALLEKKYGEVYCEYKKKVRTWI